MHLARLIRELDPETTLRLAGLIRELDHWPETLRDCDNFSETILHLALARLLRNCDHLLETILTLARQIRNSEF